MGTVNLRGVECEFGLHIDPDGWANGVLVIDGAQLAVGGGYILDREGAQRWNDCRGLQPQHGTGGAEPGELVAYEHSEAGDLDGLAEILGCYTEEALEAIEAATYEVWRETIDGIDMEAVVRVSEAASVEPAVVLLAALDGTKPGRYAWNSRVDRDDKAMHELPGWPTCECDCECEEPATTTDDLGVPVCAVCASAINVDGGVVCARMTEGFTRCHECGEEIEWGSIETAQWQPNCRRGSCGCGEEAWLEEERGSWGHYAYDPSPED